MCGATKQQKDIASQQSSFFTTMTQQAQQVFGAASGVFKDLVNTFAPVVAAGPNQEGFSGAEKTAMTTVARDSTANAYKNADKALESQIAARGGGNQYIPSGADDQMREQLAAAAAESQSNKELNITQEDYAQGRQNWAEATRGLAGAPGVFGTATGAGSAATGAGGAAEQGANDVAMADNSWVNATIGAIGGVAGAAASGGMSHLGHGGGGGGTSNG